MVQEDHRDILFEKTWQEISKAIDLFDQNDNTRLFLKSLLMGGTVAAEQATAACRGLASYWADGNQSKALGLTRLFFWMILNYYQHHIKISENDSSALIDDAEAAGKLLTIFGKLNENEMKLYVNLSSQLNHDFEKSPHFIHLSSLLLALSCEICGHKCLDWDKIHFPVKEMYHIAHNGALLDSVPIRDVNDNTEMQSALLAGIKAANLYYEKG